MEGHRRAALGVGRLSHRFEVVPSEAEALVEGFEVNWWCAELHRLRGVFLTAMGADEIEIEASFCEAIRMQRSRSRFR